MADLPAVTTSNPLARLGITPSQGETIRRMFAKGADDDEFNVFMTVCADLGLTPVRKQVYCAVYNADDAKKRQLVIMVGIDGMRSVAERSGNYMPDDQEPEYEYDESLADPFLNPKGFVKATVRVKKFAHGEWHWIKGVAHWEAFRQANKHWVSNPSGQGRVEKYALNEFWMEKGELMIAKCFSPDTEVLTDCGFQPLSAVTGRVMQVTEDGLKPTDAAPFSQPYHGPMVTLDSDDLNFCVTPNHDMVTTAGKIEAGKIFDQARSRPKFHIPRLVDDHGTDQAISDESIRLAAAYIADGSDISQSGFRISVSRPAKIARLEDIDLHHAVEVLPTAGQRAHTAVRTITTKHDKSVFSYKFDDIAGLAGPGKTCRTKILLGLSQRQARVFVDALLDFDGSTNKQTGVRRFYSSDRAHVGVFELMAVSAGYAVSPPRARTSDISSRPNYVLTISERNAISVRRWGRDYHNHKHGDTKRTGLEITTNAAGVVWCVTVPSGEIIVRRHGFSMRCGNCAEAQALRRGWPEDLSAVYEPAEIGPIIEGTATEVMAKAREDAREALLGGPDSYAISWEYGAPINHVPAGKLVEEIDQRMRDWGLAEIDWFEHNNAETLRRFWNRHKSDGVDLRGLIDDRVEALKAEGDDADGGDAKPASDSDDQDDTTGADGEAAQPKFQLTGAAWGDPNALWMDG